MKNKFTSKTARAEQAKPIFVPIAYALLSLAFLNQSFFPASEITALPLLLLAYFLSRFGFLANLLFFTKRRVLTNADEKELAALVSGALALVVLQNGGVDSVLHPLVYLALFAISVWLGVAGSIIACLTFGGLLVIAPLFAHGFAIFSPSPFVYILYYLAFTLTPFAMRRFSLIRDAKPSNTARVAKATSGETRRIASKNFSPTTRQNEETPEEDFNDEEAFTLAKEGRIHAAMEICAIALSAHSVLFLKEDETGERFTIAYSRSASKWLSQKAIAKEQGFIQGVLDSGAPVRMTFAQSGKSRLAYYNRDEGINALFAIPVMQDERITGILVVDRIEEGEFHDDEVAFAARIAIVLGYQLADTKRIKALQASHTKLVKLSELSKALAAEKGNIEEAVRFLLMKLSESFDYDFSGVALFEPNRLAYRIVAFEPDEMGLCGVRFPEGENIIDETVKLGDPIHYNDFQSLDKKPTLFHATESLDNIASLAIVPFNTSGRRPGAVVLASAEKAYFSRDDIRILKIYAALLGQMVGQIHKQTLINSMSTTDRITGLINQRHFQDRFAEILKRAGRTDGRFALAFIEIDHFKTIVKAYGLPVGDILLRVIGGHIRDSLRQTDLVARIGNHRFGVVFDGSNGEQAFKKAEELRVAIAGLHFDTKPAGFGAHVSIGISLYPTDAKEAEELVEKAEVALFQSIRTGENKTTLFAKLLNKR